MALPSLPDPLRPPPCSMQLAQAPMWSQLTMYMVAHSDI